MPSTRLRSHEQRSVCAALAAAVPMVLALEPPSLSSVHDRPMSVHNRLLLNRLAVAGYRTLEVMLVTQPSQVEHVSALTTRLGGAVRRAEPPVGYIRAELPIDRLVALVADPGID